VSIIDATNTLKEGGIIAYPTEGVFGLGCDPDNEQAINKLLHLKQRSASKGLILIASNYSQLLPYVDDSAIPQHKRFVVLSRWPGPITQILPAEKNISPLLSGSYKTIAVRVSAHPQVIALCNTFNKPIVSTSANLAGQTAANTWQEVQQQFADKIDYLLKSNSIQQKTPSKIINGLSGEVLRA
jgi:L-threonylcarbamoyladenylate synthase